MASPTPRFPTPANARPAGNHVSDGQAPDGEAPEGGVVEVNAGDLTEREAIPPLWHGRSGSVSAPLSSSPSSSRVPLPPAVVRSRRQTLVSPIPALLAAQMGDIAEDQSDSTPMPIELRQEATSRFDIAAQRALLSADELESEYVVELVPPEKPE